MKKVVLLTLSVSLALGAFAQQRVLKDNLKSAQATAKKAVVGKEMNSVSSADNFAPFTGKSVVVNRYDEMEYAPTMMTTYDLQSNHYVANRMYQLPDGSVAVTTTLSHEYNQTASDRGTGYNFYKDGQWLVDDLEDMTRVEPFKTGWPTIARWGKDGEILIAHGGGSGVPSGLQCFTREVAGEGEWQFMSTLPSCPEGYPYAGASDAYPTWARVATSGDNYNIIHVAAAIQHSISSDESAVHNVVFRSEDAVNWEVSYGPLAEVGYETGYFSADDYAMAANGHKVALLYSGSITNSVWLFESEDDGQNWTSTRVWEDPYEGADLNDMDFWYEDTLFRPMNGAVVVDHNGITHVALNVFEMWRTEGQEAGYYTYFTSRFVDGILYWNSTQEAPIQSPDGNPHHAARLWWPDEENPGYVTMKSDSTRWIGFIPFFEDFTWSNEMLYGNEYVSKFYGPSGHPALSCDPLGNLACAYSSPCMAVSDPTDPHYFRHIYVSYRNVDEGYWHQIEDDLSDPEEIFELSSHDNIFTISVPNTVNPGEFWFGFQSDDQIGLYWGTNSSQENASENELFVMKVIASPEMVSVPENNDAINPMTSTRIYPNPVVDQMTIEVNAAQASEMSISVFNLMGQKVMDKNVSINTGINTPTLNTSSLSSGVYFVTVKANGFENTMKFVVK